MRFPSRLLAANVWFAGMLWAGFVVVVALIAAVVAVFGDLNTSAWEPASQLPRWYALFAGVALIREFLPMYIAHGQTRREFGLQAAVTTVLFAPFLSTLVVLGYLMETGIYHLADLPQRIGRPHLFTEPTQVHLVFAEYLVEFLAWLIAGTLIGAAYYRWEANGLVFTIPLGIGIVVLAKATVGTDLPLPVIENRLSLDLSGQPVLSAVIGVATLLGALALTWSIIRDLPLRNDPA